MSAIHDKIKKLLNLANNAGATEHEAANAMSKASALMLEHGIRAEDLAETDRRVGTGSSMTTEDRKYREVLVGAAGNLYGCIPLYSANGVDFRYVGRAEVIAAAEVTYAFLSSQLENLYKSMLPPGMTKSARAEYRRTFKMSCAIRLANRIREIVRLSSETDNAAYAGSRALVVVEHRKTLLDEAWEAIKAAGGERSPPRSVSVKASRGSADGMRAADTVRLHQQVR